MKLNGALTLPDLYRTISLIPAGDDAWLDFAFEMNESGWPISERVEAEIAASRGSSSNGFQGILGELFKAFSALSDPLLLNAVSPPFDASLSDLCRSDQAYQLYLMAPAEVLQNWSPVIKAIFVSAMIYKARAPQAPRQTWILDECAQLGAFPLIGKLFAYGAGIGVRPWAVYQNTQQMNATIEHGEAVLTGSAALRSYFAVRDLGGANTVSRMLGQQTLRYDDRLQQERAAHARRKAVQSMMQGGDPLTALLEAKHQSTVEAHQTKQQRALQSPDEMLNMPGDRQIIFCDGLSAPLYAERKPYFQQRFMAGRYLPNPYHPPLTKVQVMTSWGPRWRRVIERPAPSHLAHYPQYRSHPCRNVE